MSTLPSGSLSPRGNPSVCIHPELPPLTLSRCLFKASNSSSLREVKSSTLLASCLHCTFVNSSWTNDKSSVPNKSCLSRVLKSSNAEQIFSNSLSPITSEHKNLRSSRFCSVTSLAIWRRRILYGEPMNFFFDRSSKPQSCWSLNYMVIVWWNPNHAPLDEKKWKFLILICYWYVGVFPSPKLTLLSVWFCTPPFSLFMNHRVPGP